MFLSERLRAFFCLDKCFYASILNVLGAVLSSQGQGAGASKGAELDPDWWRLCGRQCESANSKY